MRGIQILTQWWRADPELVLEQADNVDRALARGEDPGPLAGVLVTTDINTDDVGFATTNGTRSQANRVAQTIAPL